MKLNKSMLLYSALATVAAVFCFLRQMKNQ